MNLFRYFNDPGKPEDPPPRVVPDTNDEVLEELKDIKTNIAALRLKVGRSEGATAQLRGTLHMFTGLVIVTILAAAIISIAYVVAAVETCS